MAPPKVLLGQNRQNSNATSRKGMTTRSQNAMLNNIFKHTNVIRDARTKRKAEASPPKEKTNKRHAFANITNVCIAFAVLSIIVYKYVLLDIIVFLHFTGYYHIIGRTE